MGICLGIITFKSFFSLRQDRDQYEKILKDLEDSVRQTERHINTLKKRLNEIEAYISELECAKENAKKGWVKFLKYSCIHITSAP